MADTAVNPTMADTAVQPAANGEANREAIATTLTAAPLTEGYRPTLPTWALESDWLPQVYLLRDVELMMTHPKVLDSLRYFKSGIAGAEFWGGPSLDNSPNGKPISDDPKVAEFVVEQCHRFWDRGIPKLQGGYEYGWMGAECLYENDGGMMLWKDLIQFSPRDVFLLTQDRRPIGVRVKNVQPTEKRLAEAGNIGEVDLWLASSNVPAKGLWYVHEPRYQTYYGQSQLIGSWRPWRRLAWKDGAETVIDTGVYRFAFCGPVIGFPEEDYQSPLGTPATTLDSRGAPRRFARDVARQIGEYAKAGATIGLPSNKYPPDLGGGDKWTLIWPEHALDVAPLIGYAKYLEAQISTGIGVPPELLESGETGSGYSGRVIPTEAFLNRQQHIADALLWLFVCQVLEPLVRWNFGPQARFTVQVKSLLESKRKAQGGGTPASPPAEGRMVGPNDGATSRPDLPGQKEQPPGTKTPYDAAHQTGPNPSHPAKFSLSPELVTDRVRTITRRILQQAA